MADISRFRNPWPFTASTFEVAPNFDVKFSAHAASIAKFCAISKQHFATQNRKTLHMEKKPVVQIVAESLAWHMADKKTNAKVLGEKAGVSPRTVGNFLNPKKRTESASGKAPSGKLTELEMIANALGIKVSDLVTDMSSEEREKRQRFERAYAIMNGQDPGNSNTTGGATDKANHPLAA